MADLTKERFAAKSVEYETPQDLWDEWNSEFAFTCDVCSTHENAKHENHYTLAEDGLAQPWSGACWCNPPYGREMPKWIQKARLHAELGSATTVMLIPARTNTGWWHDQCMKGEIRFLRGRPKFNGGKHGLPFPLALVIFRANTDLSGGIPYAPNSCSAWIPVESEPVPEGVVCDMVHDGWDRMTNVIYLDDWVYCEDAMHYDPNGDGPDPIELCPIGEITHWAKIVMPND